MIPRDDIPPEAIAAAVREIERYGWPYKKNARGVARVMLTAALPHVGSDPIARAAVLDDHGTPAEGQEHAPEAQD